MALDGFDGFGPHEQKNRHLIGYQVIHIGCIVAKRDEEEGAG